MPVNQQDEWLQQATEQALGEIARFHEYALQAVWSQYPAPASRHAHADPDAPSWPDGPDADRSP